MSSPNEIDRSPPIGLLLFGESFLEAARHLHRSMEGRSLHLRFNAPIYQLFAHAFELMLKSYLRSKGKSVSELKNKHGHNLEKLYKASVDLGLVITKNEHIFITCITEWLTETSKSQDFRYLTTGAARYPELTELDRAGEILLSAIRPHCHQS